MDAGSAYKQERRRRGLTRHALETQSQIRGDMWATGKAPGPGRNSGTTLTG